MANAAMQTKVMEYKQGNAIFEGYLARFVPLWLPTWPIQRFLPLADKRHR